jgi:hypothetical protein
MVQYFDFGKLGKETHWVGYLPYGVSQEGDRVFMTKRKHCSNRDCAFTRGKLQSSRAKTDMIYGRNYGKDVP